MYSSKFVLFNVSGPVTLKLNCDILHTDQPDINWTPDGGVTLSELLSWVPSVEQVLSYNGSSPKCVEQMAQLLHHAEALDSHALEVLDSWAKLPSGLLRGNINQLGDFDQCMEAGGRYCLTMVDFRLPTALAALDTKLHAHYAMRSTINDPGHRVPRFSLVQWAVCVPAACSPEDLNEGLRHILSGNGKGKAIRAAVRVDPDLCQSPSDAPTASPLGIRLAWLFFVVVFLICLLGTGVDMLRQSASGSEPGKFEKTLVAFSLKRNAEILLSADSKREDISSIHGVRALNALGLLLSHKQMALMFLPFVNRTQLGQSLGRAWTMTGRAASLYTDSFILLSGLLSGLSLLRELAATNTIDIKHYVISRFIRLTPSLAALIIFSTFILPSLGSGPFWGLLVKKYAELCHQHWWRNLLYIHNQFPFDQMCLTHSHQVAIDMQLSLSAPLLVYLLWRWPTAGLTALVSAAVWSSFLRYYVSIAQNLTTIIYHGIPLSQLFQSAQNTYILPSHRATVYCIGIALGYFIHQRKSCSISNVQRLLGWVVAVVCGLLAMFSLYHMSWRGCVYNPQQAAMYSMLAPALWSLFVGWVIFASHYGYGGWISHMLSWRWFTVFTKFSYAVYLTQFPIFFYNVGQVRAAQEYSFFKLLDIPELVLILLASTTLALLFDSPAQNLKKLFFSSRKGKKKETEEEKNIIQTKMNEEYPDTQNGCMVKKLSKRRLPGDF